MNKEMIEWNRKKLHEILDIVLDTNGQEPRSRERTGTMPTVFLSFSGHVSKISIDIYPNGWERSDYATGTCITKEAYADVEISQKFVNTLRNACTMCTKEDQVKALEKSIELKTREVEKNNAELAKMKESYFDLISKPEVQE